MAHGSVLLLSVIPARRLNLEDSDAVLLTDRFEPKTSMDAAAAGVSAPRAAAPLLLLFFLCASLFATAASAAAANSPSFVLAAAQTQREDPLDGLRYYTGGWNISDEHYWASVGFTAAPIFAAAGVWFVAFGIALFLTCCCCPGRRGDSYARARLTVSLVLLLAATAAAAVGCAVLYDGQGRFHGSTTATVDYVARQSGDTVANLRSFSGFLETAKAAGVGSVTLPADVKGKIDDVVRKVSAASDELATRTSNNADKIRASLETVYVVTRKVLIIVAAAMLILASLGLVLSLCGLESIIYMLVFFGWILVAGTFVLCGTFLLLHNVVGDTCVAMGEWVRHPQAHTALDDILPCVDTAAATEALDRSKEVNYHLVAVLNGALANVSNRDFPPQAAPLYYNQSGPPVPLLCNPYTPYLHDRACAPGEVALDAAQQAWWGYVCRTTTAGGAPGSSEVCATAGRITPSMYAQLTGAANVSYGLYHYGPVLAGLADCTFVRETFRSIGDDHCPGLRRYSGQVFRGLLGAAAAVMLAMLLWVVHSRERRRRSEAMKLMVSSPYKFHVEEKAFLNSPVAATARPYQ